MSEYLKLLNEDGTTPQGYGRWSMPTQNDDGSWTPGDWYDISRGPRGGKRREMKECTDSALHILTVPQALEWGGGRLYWVEVEGRVKAADDKTLCHKARALRPALSRDASYLFSIDCSRHVSDLWHPDDAALLGACLDVMTAEALYGEEWAGAAREAARAARAARNARAAWAVWDAWAAQAARAARAAEADWQVERLTAYLACATEWGDV